VLQQQQQTVLGGLRGGFVFVTSDDADDASHCQETRCGRLYTNVLTRAYTTSGLVNTTRAVLAIGAASGVARTSLQSWLALAGIPWSVVTAISSASDVRAANFTQFRMIYVASSSSNLASGGVSNQANNELVRRVSEIQTYVNQLGGSLVVLTQEARATFAVRKRTSPPHLPCRSGV
jgi:hypothetical protein